MMPAARPEAATYQLRGRLRTAGSKGRLSLSLIRQADGLSVWSQTYEDDTSDIFLFCDNLI